MTRHFFIGVLAAGVLLSAHPASACGERVEVAFFEADGDIFEITNKVTRAAMKRRVIVL